MINQRIRGVAMSFSGMLLLIGLVMGFGLGVKDVTAETPVIVGQAKSGMLAFGDVMPWVDLEPIVPESQSGVVGATGQGPRRVNSSELSISWTPGGSTSNCMFTSEELNKCNFSSAGVNMQSYRGNIGNCHSTSYGGLTECSNGGTKPYQKLSYSSVYQQYRFTHIIRAKENRSTALSDMFVRNDEDDILLYDFAVGLVDVPPSSEFDIGTTVGQGHSPSLAGLNFTNSSREGTSEVHSFSTGLYQVFVQRGVVSNETLQSSDRIIDYMCKTDSQTDCIDRQMFFNQYDDILPPQQVFFDGNFYMFFQVNVTSKVDDGFILVSSFAENSVDESVGSAGLRSYISFSNFNLKDNESLLVKFRSAIGHEEDRHKVTVEPYYHSTRVNVGDYLSLAFSNYTKFGRNFEQIGKLKIVGSKQVSLVDAATNITTYKFDSYLQMDHVVKSSSFFIIEMSTNGLQKGKDTLWKASKSIFEDSPIKGSSAYPGPGVQLYKAPVDPNDAGTTSDSDGLSTVSYVLIFGGCVFVATAMIAGVVIHKQGGFAEFAKKMRGQKRETGDDDDIELPHKGASSAQLMNPNFIPSAVARVPSHSGSSNSSGSVRNSLAGVGLMNNFGLVPEAGTASPIHYAASVGDVAYLHRVIMQMQSQHPEGVNIDALDVNGSTPLMLAIKSGSVKCVKLLLSIGASAHAVNMDADMPLNLACRNGRADLAVLLLRSGALINPQIPGVNLPLVDAVMSGEADIVHLLLENGADPNAMDEEGDCALIVAARLGFHNILKLLLSASAIVHNTDRRMWTALHWSAVQGDLTACTLLLNPKLKANVNAKSKNEETPLHLASREGFAEICRLLLRYKAFANAQDKEGRTALDMAMSRMHYACVNVLREVNAEGREPSPAAFVGGSPGVIAGSMASNATTSPQLFSATSPYSHLSAHSMAGSLSPDGRGISPVSPGGLSNPLPQTNFAMNQQGQASPTIGFPADISLVSNTSPVPDYSIISPQLGDMAFNIDDPVVKLEPNSNPADINNQNNSQQ
eukprot:Nk52_evm32s270 gene=Nk52_evmTU32s270